MLPNFFIIGAPKCGTTSLCELLGKHPDIFMCSPKEPRFFSHDDIFSRGLAWYESLFEYAGSKKAIGEGSTSYATASCDQKSAARIDKVVPGARLIYCVRHPMRRIESIWMEHHASAFSCGRSFNEGKVSSDFNEDVMANAGFVETSCYWKRISAFRERFSDDQIYVFFLEDFQADPHGILSKCFDFLKVDPKIRIADVGQPKNVSSKKKLPTRLGLFLRQLPMFNRFLNIAPKPVRLFISPIIEQRITKRPAWRPEVLHFVSDHLAGDISAFLKYCNKPLDYWEFNDVNILGPEMHKRKYPFIN